MAKKNKTQITQIERIETEPQIKRFKLSELHPAEYNPRIISDEALIGLKESIKKFGMVEPIIVNVRNGANRIVGGNQRFKALQMVGGPSGAPRINDRKIICITVDLSDSDEKTLNLVLNNPHIQGEFVSKLGEYIDMLREGMASQQDYVNMCIDKLRGEIEKVSKTDDDEVPELPKKTKTKIGDLYLLGEHRLLCGDSTKKEDAEKLMGENKADMVFIDPPYGVNYGHDQQELQEKSGGKFSKTRKRTQIKNDNLNIKEISEKIWSPSFRNLYEIAKDNCSFYMTMCQGGEQMMMMMKMNEHWQIKHELIWVKNALVFSMGRLDYDYQHEPILFGWKKKHNFYGKGQFLKSIWQINKPIKSDLHPTMKPVELIENALLNSSNNKDLVIDFFLGSGTTLIACEKLNRRCFGMEIEPIYCDVAVKRWEEFTGRKAELVRGGIAPKESKLSQVQSGA